MAAAWPAPGLPLGPPLARRKSWRGGAGAEARGVPGGAELGCSLGVRAHGSRSARPPPPPARPAVPGSPSLRLTLSVRRPCPPRAGAVDVLDARRLRRAGPMQRRPLGCLQGAHPHGHSADPPGEGCPAKPRGKRREASGAHGHRRCPRVPGNYRLSLSPGRGRVCSGDALNV